MKIVQSSMFRALCAMVIGALLVMYREEMVTWMTISIGVLFFISGVISCIAYFVQRSLYQKMESEGIAILDSNGNKVQGMSPTFPIVGIGSAVLGVILACMPATFINGLVYILSAIIILGAINQFTALLIARKYGKIHWAFWVMPILMFIAAIVAIVNPNIIATAPFFFIGWCMMIYGVVECINAIKIHLVRKSYQNANAVPEVEALTEPTE